MNDCLEQYINFNSAGAEEAAMMLKDCASFHSSPLFSNNDDNKNKNSLIQESSLANTFSQHLQKKVQIDPKTSPNNINHILNINENVPSTFAEIWSEANSDVENELNTLDEHARSRLNTIIGNGHLKNTTYNNNNNSQPHSSSSPKLNNINIHNPSHHSSKMKINSTSKNVNNNNNSALNKEQRTTVSAIIALPNMRRKLFVLLFLTATHFSMYINFTYFIEDFIGEWFQLVFMFTINITQIYQYISL